MGTITADRRDSEAQAATNQARLQKIVLSWDYFRLLSVAKVKRKKRKRGDKAKEELIDGSSLNLRDVPEKFKDLEEYLSVFESLLLEECRAQIIRGEEEGGGTQCHMVALATWEKANEFYFTRLAVQPDVAEEFTENDLLLLSKEKPLGGTSLPSTYAFASVEAREGSGTLRVRMHLDGETNDSDGLVIKTTAAALRLRAALQGPTSAWWLMKLCNMSTILREYAALCSVGTLPFVGVILSAADSSNDGADPDEAPTKSASNLGHWNIPLQLKEYLSGTHNPSQMQAIQAGLTRKPFVLIQGPPGTGKTQTILGLLSVILHSTPARLPSKNGAVEIAIRDELPYEEKIDNWLKASPWLGTGLNPRDLMMPVDGDDGYFPPSHNPFRPKTVGAKRKCHAHVLVCAPSNSALDEIVLRLMRAGLRDENGMMYTPNLVRVGLNVHHSVQAVSMDTLVQHRLSSTERSAVTAGPRSSAGMERDRVRIQILDEAAIVCSTLSFSGAGIFKRMNRGFDVVVIDEAAQAMVRKTSSFFKRDQRRQVLFPTGAAKAGTLTRIQRSRQSRMVEPSTMVPLMHGCRQVGDPVQLPATVLSTSAVEHGYGTSLFKRFQKGGYPVQILKTQYRMHPQIREFPSKEFYADTLEDGSEIELQASRPWHEHHCFGPFVFYDISGKETQPRGSGSWVNQDEAEFVLTLYQCMAGKYPTLKEAPNVAIISPYKQQVKLLREMFRDVIGVEATRLIDINTVDGFQGREKDIAIFSCVRANVKGGIGFVSDFRRMNVGLTRARASMLVVGCAAALKQDKHWKNLISSARARRRLLKVTKPYHTFFYDQNLAAMKAHDEEEAAKRLAATGTEEKTGSEKKSIDIEMEDIDVEEEHSDEEEDIVNNGDFDAEDEDI